MKKISRILLLIMTFTVILGALSGCDAIDKALEALGKVWGTAECEHTGGTATCENKAICEKCGKEYGELAEHTVVVIPGEDATCENPGKTEGSYCSVCGETIKSQQTISALGHKEETVPGKAATCTEDGLTDGKKCSVCNKILVAQETIPAGHKDENGDNLCDDCGEAICAHEHTKTLEGKDATCTESGLTEGTYCEDCQKTIVPQQEIPAGHKWVTVPGKDATCTEDGLTDGKQCSECKEWQTEQTVIAAGHNWQTVTGKAETCTENGLTDGVQCSKCKEWQVEQVEIPAGHVIENGACKNCEYTEENTLRIGSADDLLAFADSVKNGNYYAGWTVYLTADINLNGVKFGGIGVDTVVGYNTGAAFCGTFEGNDHIISNMKIVNENHEQGYGTAGFFNRLGGTAVVRNINFVNIEISGYHYVGAVTGYMTGTSETAGIYGVKVQNSTIISKAELIDGKYDNGDKVGGIAGYVCNAKISGCTVTDTELTAVRDIGGILGCADGTTTVTGCTVESVTINVDGEFIDRPENYGSIVGRANGTGDVTTDNSGEGTFNVIPHVHKYDDGVCVCGDEKLDEIFYLIGYINGADYGNGNDWQNLGEYRFVNGKLTATFSTTAETYVGIKTKDNNHWYWFESYVDLGTTSGKLVLNGSEKMKIPGGVEVHFTLVKNDDGSLTLSYHVHTDADENFVCDTCNEKLPYPKAGSTISIKQAIAIAAAGGSGEDKYYVQGTVKNVYNTQYGNMYIQDAGGNELCVYGTYSEDGSVRYDSLEQKPVVGDTITVYGVLMLYNNSTKQMKNAWVTIDAHEHSYSEATCKKLATCACGATTGDYADHTFESGLCTVCGAEDPDYQGEIVLPTEYVCDFGANGTAKHNDGTKISDSSKTFDAGIRTITLTNIKTIYSDAFDAKGNSCLKLGTGSGVASFTLTVDDDVTEVVIYVAMYKDKNTSVIVNGTTYSITTKSNDGEYTPITIDTRTNKTINFATASSSTARCMIDKIVLKA